jgi:hypothetical protein
LVSVDFDRPENEKAANNLFTAFNFNLRAVREGFEPSVEI